MFASEFLVPVSDPRGRSRRFHLLRRMPRGLCDGESPPPPPAAYAGSGAGMAAAAAAAALLWTLLISLEYSEEICVVAQLEMVLV